jgi:mannose-6-phosphate isomerase-like protein (cupin superfamily)
MIEEAVPAKYAIGQSDNRPWGSWDVVDTGEQFAVKRIQVSPGKRLSLQYHHKRTEHWVVVAGTGCVTVGSDLLRVEPGSHVHIPGKIPHRIMNDGDGVLTFIEVQLGKELSEDDIVRIEDDFNRD